MSKRITQSILRFSKGILFVLLAASASTGVFAQESVSEFGKNRVQYKNFTWKFFSSENFDVYYYEDGEDNARLAIDYLEEQFDAITEVIGYAPYTKINIFLYNSITDLQQSNVGVNEKTYSVGGQTNFIKSQVEIAYPGVRSDFKSELVFKVTRMLINDMMFGGSLSDMFQNAYLLSLPDWFMDGAASYVAYGWDAEMESVV